MDAEAVAACAFSAVPGIGASAMARIARALRGLRQALEAGPRAILERGDEFGLRAETRAYLAQAPDLRALGEWAAEAARKAGARVVLPRDGEYPEALRTIRNPPQVLYVRGELATGTRRVAVVGSRDTDEIGMDLARDFGDGLARAGIEVVSGGARGIDTGAHEGALWAQGRSIAVLGSGIDVPYPVENRVLFDRLANGGGAVLTELPPGAQPAARNFPRRNRIVAGMSDAVVVVRAAAQSGALITARQAIAEDRPVFVVPGDPGRRSEGSNSLLQSEEARAATSASDILREMGWPVPQELQPHDATHSGRPASNPTGVPDRAVIDEAGVRLWQLLDGRTPTHVDDLALRAQIPAREALGKLAELELKGMAVRRPGKYFLRR
jgi:DNA processing protein